MSAAISSQSLGSRARIANSANRVGGPPGGGSAVLVSAREFGTLSSVAAADLRIGPNKKSPVRGRRGLIKSVTRTSVRNALHRPAGAGHVLARTDRYDVTHAGLIIPKRVQGKWVYLRPGGISSQRFVSLDPSLDIQ